MIDSRATGNFMSEPAAIALGLRIQKNRNLYALTLVDRTDTKNGLISKETALVQMEIHQNH